MPPKKKGAKKGADDWEAELGEIPDPIAAATQAAKEETAAKVEDEEDLGGGGLLAALKKNKAKKQKKGKIVQEDYVDGEDPPDVNGVNGHVATEATDDLTTKAPEEATADDLFAEPTKGKGGKEKQTKVDAKPAEDEDEELGEDGKVKSKKEKEKEKKEREKQRKKEQVGHICSKYDFTSTNTAFLF
jgi:translation initiation factor 5B